MSHLPVTSEKLENYDSSFEDISPGFRKRKTYENRRLNEHTSPNSSSIKSSSDLNCSTSRYGRTRRPKITEDFYNIEDIFVPYEKISPKSSKKKSRLDISPIKNQSINIDANDKNIDLETVLSIDIPDDNLEVTKVLKIVSNKSPSQFSPKSPSYSTKPVKTYSNKNRKITQDNIIESFALPDYDIDMKHINGMVYKLSKEQDHDDQSRRETMLETISGVESSTSAQNQLKSSNISMKFDKNTTKVDKSDVSFDKSNNFDSNSSSFDAKSSDFDKNSSGIDTRSINSANVDAKATKFSTKQANFDKKSSKFDTSVDKNTAPISERDQTVIKSIEFDEDEPLDLLLKRIRNEKRKIKRDESLDKKSICVDTNTASVSEIDRNVINSIEFDENERLDLLLKRIRRAKRKIGRNESVKHDKTTEVKLATKASDSCGQNVVKSYAKLVQNKSESNEKRRRIMHKRLTAKKSVNLYKKVLLNDVFNTIWSGVTQNEVLKENDEDKFVMDFNYNPEIGSLSWARVGSYPFWPAIISKEPDYDRFMKSAIYGRRPETLYHLNFFGDNGRRSWVPRTHLFPFKKRGDLEEMAKYVSKDARLKEPRHISAFIIHPSKLKKWENAVTEAETLFQFSPEQRVKKFTALIAKKNRKNRKNAASKSPKKIRIKLSRKSSRLKKLRKKLLSKTIKKSFLNLPDSEIIESRVNNAPKRKLQSLKPAKIVNANSEKQIKKEKQIKIEDEIKTEAIEKDDKGEKNEKVDKLDTPSPSSVQSQASKQKRNNLFRGVTKERVCQICINPKEVFKCKGSCFGLFHIECDKKVLDDLQDKCKLNNDFNSLSNIPDDSNSSTDVASKNMKQLVTDNDNDFNSNMSMEKEFGAKQVLKHISDEKGKSTENSTTDKQISEQDFDKIEEEFNSSKIDATKNDPPIILSPDKFYPLPQIIDSSKKEQLIDSPKIRDTKIDPSKNKLQKTTNSDPENSSTIELQGSVKNISNNSDEQMFLKNKANMDLLQNIDHKSTEIHKTDLRNEENIQNTTDVENVISFLLKSDYDKTIKVRTQLQDQEENISSDFIKNQINSTKEEVFKLKSTMLTNKTECQSTAQQNSNCDAQDKVLQTSNVLLGLNYQNSESEEIFSEISDVLDQLLSKIDPSNNILSKFDEPYPSESTSNETNSINTVLLNPNVTSNLDDSSISSNFETSNEVAGASKPVSPNYDEPSNIIVSNIDGSNKILSNLDESNSNVQESNAILSNLEASKTCQTIFSNSSDINAVMPSTESSNSLLPTSDLLKTVLPVVDMKEVLENLNKPKIQVNLNSDNSELTSNSKCAQNCDQQNKNIDNSTLQKHILHKSDTKDKNCASHDTNLHNIDSETTILSNLHVQKTNLKDVQQISDTKNTITEKVQQICDTKLQENVAKIVESDESSNPKKIDCNNADRSNCKAEISKNEIESSLKNVEHSKTNIESTKNNPASSKSDRESLINNPGSSKSGISDEEITKSNRESSKAHVENSKSDRQPSKISNQIEKSIEQNKNTEIDTNIKTENEQSCSYITNNNSGKKRLTISEQIDLKMAEIMKDLIAVTKYSVSSEEDSDIEVSVKSEHVSVKSDNNNDRVIENQSIVNKRVFKHVTADGVYELVEESEVESTKNSNFKCAYCRTGITPPCFLCSEDISKYGDSVKHRCLTAQCGKYYHAECLREWPQTKWRLVTRGKRTYNENLCCPYHNCHTCISDDPRGPLARYTNEKLAKCIKCPTTYHSSNYCIPAGTEILSSYQIICPKHWSTRTAKHAKKFMPHVNASWCFICSIGGSLICCETCPSSFHVECLKLVPPEGRYLCEECESGRLPLFGEVVWVKLGSYRWWPAQILFPNEIPENVKNIAHNQGEFVVRFFGSHDHYWVNRGRVFIFQEGDNGNASAKKTSFNGLFVVAVQEAKNAHKHFLEERVNRAAGQQIGMKPPPYIKIKFNRAVGDVRCTDGDTSNTTACECDPNSETPCGPDSDCLNRILLTECNPLVCPAGMHCCNQSFEKRQYARIQPFRTCGGRGWGLRTLESISKGSFVIEYVGEIINETEYRRRLNRKHEQKDENYYFLTIDKDRMIDAGPKGNEARFMNHSCTPNCETQKWTVNGDTRVGLFAILDILAGDELTFNYNLECIGEEKKVCRCGSSNCSGFIGLKVKQDENGKRKKSLGKPKKKKSTELKQEVTIELCTECGKIGALQTCDRDDCKKCYHLKCVNLKKSPDDKWICPAHFCKNCSKKSTNICQLCTNSYCKIHSSQKVHYDWLKGIVCDEHTEKQIKKLEDKINNRKLSITSRDLRVQHRNKIRSKTERKTKRSSPMKKSIKKTQLKGKKLLNTSTSIKKKAKRIEKLNDRTSEDKETDDENQVQGKNLKKKIENTNPNNFEKLDTKNLDVITNNSNENQTNENLDDGRHKNKNLDDVKRKIGKNLDKAKNVPSANKDLDNVQENLDKKHEELDNREQKLDEKQQLSTSDQLISNDFIQTPQNLNEISSNLTTVTQIMGEEIQEETFSKGLTSSTPKRNQKQLKDNKKDEISEIDESKESGHDIVHKNEEKSSQKSKNEMELQKLDKENEKQLKDNKKNEISEIVESEERNNDIVLKNEEKSSQKPKKVIELQKLDRENEKLDNKTQSLGNEKQISDKESNNLDKTLPNFKKLSLNRDKTSQKLVNSSQNLDKTTKNLDNVTQNLDMLQSSVQSLDNSMDKPLQKLDKISQTSDSLLQIVDKTKTGLKSGEKIESNDQKSIENNSALLQNFAPVTTTSDNDSDGKILEMRTTKKIKSSDEIKSKVVIPKHLRSNKMRSVVQQTSNKRKFHELETQSTSSDDDTTPLSKLIKNIINKPVDKVTEQTDLTSIKSLTFKSDDTKVNESQIKSKKFGRLSLKKHETTQEISEMMTKDAQFGKITRSKQHLVTDKNNKTELLDIKKSQKKSDILSSTEKKDELNKNKIRLTRSNKSITDSDVFVTKTSEAIISNANSVMLDKEDTDIPMPSSSKIVKQLIDEHKQLKSVTDSESEISDSKVELDAIFDRQPLYKDLLSISANLDKNLVQKRKKYRLSLRRNGSTPPKSPIISENQSNFQPNVINRSRKSSITPLSPRLRPKTPNLSEKRTNTTHNQTKLPENQSNLRQKQPHLPENQPNLRKDSEKAIISSKKPPNLSKSARNSPQNASSSSKNATKSLKRSLSSPESLLTSPEFNEAKSPASKYPRKFKIRKIGVRKSLRINHVPEMIPISSRNKQLLTKVDSTKMDLPNTSGTSRNEGSDTSTPNSIKLNNDDTFFSKKKDKEEMIVTKEAQNEEDTKRNVSKVNRKLKIFKLGSRSSLRSQKINLIRQKVIELQDNKSTSQTNDAKLAEKDENMTENDKKTSQKDTNISENDKNVSTKDNSTVNTNSNKCNTNATKTNTTLVENDTDSSKLHKNNVESNESTSKSNELCHIFDSNTESDSSCTDLNKKKRKRTKSDSSQTSDTNSQMLETNPKPTSTIDMQKRGRPRKFKLVQTDAKNVEMATELYKQKFKKGPIPKNFENVREIKMKATVPERHLRVLLRKSPGIDTRNDNKFIKMQNDIEKDLPIRKRSKLRLEVQS